MKDRIEYIGSIMVLVLTSGEFLQSPYWICMTSTSIRIGVLMLPESEPIIQSRTPSLSTCLSRYGGRLCLADPLSVARCALQGGAWRVMRLSGPHGHLQHQTPWRSTTTA